MSKKLDNRSHFDSSQSYTVRTHKTHFSLIRASIASGSTSVSYFDQNPCGLFSQLMLAKRYFVPALKTAISNRGLTMFL